MADTQDGAWRARPVLSALVRVVQYGIPLAVGWAAARAVRAVLVGHVDPLWVVVLAVSTAVGVSLLASRVTIRLAPLALLLHMTMVFPDRAPSRIRVARRSTSATDIRQLLDGDDTSAHEAAVTMLALVTALSHHDKKTRGHSERVRLFCDLLSEELDLPEPDRARLRWAALIHDIGKLEVSTAILNKPGTLSDREWQVVRSHPATGARLARPLADWLGPWYPGIIQHHERYDGTGYPMGLAGEQISLAGRAVCIVDAFETMTAARSYKAARTVLAARAELTRCAGTHFDPALVRCFLGIALPRLLWAVGPLAFLVNAPMLRWVGDGGARVVDLTGATAQAAVTTAGVTAVVATSGVASAPAVPAPATTRPAHSTPAAGQPTTRGDAADRRTPAAPSPTSVAFEASPTAVPATASPTSAPATAAARGNSGKGRSGTGKPAKPEPGKPAKPEPGKPAKPEPGKGKPEGTPGKGKRDEPNDGRSGKGEPKRSASEQGSGSPTSTPPDPQPPSSRQPTAPQPERPKPPKPSGKH